MYAEYEASVSIDGELLAGSLPVKQLKLVRHGLLSMRMSFTPLGTTRYVVFHLARSRRCSEEMLICMLWMELPTQGHPRML